MVTQKLMVRLSAFLLVLALGIGFWQYRAHVEASQDTAPRALPPEPLQPGQPVIQQPAPQPPPSQQLVALETISDVSYTDMVKTDVDTVDAWGERSLRQSNTLRDRSFWVEEKGVANQLRGSGWSPVLGDEGSVYYVSSQFALVKLHASGTTTELLPKGQAGGLLTFDPSRRYLAYIKPASLLPDDEFVDKYGVAIYDTSSGKEVTSRVIEHTSSQPVGWADGKLLVQEWDHSRWAESLDLSTLDLNGTFHPFMTGLPVAGTLIDQSFDGRFLAYQVYEAQDSIVIDTKIRSAKVLAGIASPHWTPAGLSGLLNGKWVRVNYR